ncbi:Histone-lysine N-methyltransferase, H3 lysine-79 specific [Blomia tropicalis]|nr:Histone-lysine N-methyltransferase, H3 lysine-79 specific [Blomia tropicalis]
MKDPETMGILKNLKLLSPWTHDYVEYEWPLVIPNNKFNAATEIIETIRFIAKEFPELTLALEKNVLNSYDPQSYESMKCLCDKYNKVIKDTRHLNMGTSIHHPNDDRPSEIILHHVLQLSYNYSIRDPQKLNKFYEPFSPEVYGETSYQFVQQMVNQFNFTENDVFIDLGSGVGQVVLHVAAASKCRCIGIEKADLPAEYAERMQNRFRLWMKWFGKSCSEFELYKGDFFDQQFSEMIHSASFIFVNNFAFGPEVDHRLKAIFENLRDGARILSSKAFCALNFRISHRNLSDIGAIMRVKEIIPKDTQSVSWTGKPVAYFLHYIDRTELEKYFEKYKQSRLKNDKKGNRKRDKDNNGGDNNSSPNLDNDNGTNTNQNQNQSVDYGTTTVCSSTNKKNNRGRPKKTTLVAKAIENVLPSDENVQPEEIESFELNEMEPEKPMLNETEEQTVDDEPKVDSNGRMRRPGRPRKSPKKTVVKRKPKPPPNVNLDILHKHTVESIGFVGKAPPPGCVEHKLCIANEHVSSLPNILLNDGVTLSGLEELCSPAISTCGNEFNVPLVNNPNGVKLYDLQNKVDLFSVFEYSMNKHVEYSNAHKEEFKSKLLFEKARKGDILNKMNKLNSELYEYQYNNKQLVKEMLTRCGAETVEQFVLIYNQQAKRNMELKALKAELTEKSMTLANECLLLMPNTITMAEKYVSDCNKRANEALNKRDQSTETIDLFVKQATDNGSTNDQFINATTIPKHEDASPKPNYKDMKYKKYLLNESNDSTLKLSNKINIDPNSLPAQLNNSNMNMLPPIGEHPNLDEKQLANNIDLDLTNSNGSNQALVCNIDRINSIICKALLSGKEVQDQQQMKPSINGSNMTNVNNKMGSMSSSNLNMINGHGLSPTKPPTQSINTTKSTRTKATPKRERKRIDGKSKFDTIKTNKNRQLILTNSAGVPTTQLVRNPPPPSTLVDSNSNVNTENHEKKLFPVKLKIKDNKVINLNNLEEMSSSSNDCGNKRKMNNEDSHSNKRKAKEQKQDNNVEPKRPPVVLKLATGNNGQYYPKNDDNNDPIVPKKTFYRATQPEPLISNSIAKQQQQQPTNDTSLPIPTLKLSNLHSTQYIRNNSDETNIQQSKDTMNQSPALSYSSSRSSSVDSSASHNIQATMKKSGRKSRSSKNQKLEAQTQQQQSQILPQQQLQPNHQQIQPNDYLGADCYTYPMQNQCQLNQPQVSTAASSTFQQQQQQQQSLPSRPQSTSSSHSTPTPDNIINNYSSAINLMNMTDPTKTIFNNGSSYLPNGLNQNFNPSPFFHMNKNYKNSQEPIIHQNKLKDSSKVATTNRYYPDVNGTMKQPPIDSINFPYSMNSCMMEKTNPTELLNQQVLAASQVAYDYSTMIYCRYDNSKNYMANSALHAATNFDAIKQKTKPETQLPNTHSNGYYNQSVIF